MENTILKPQFVIDESGKKSAVLLNIKEYERLLETLEELVDSSDFTKARKTSRKLISTSELRKKVFKNK